MSHTDQECLDRINYLLDLPNSNGQFLTYRDQLHGLFNPQLQADAIDRSLNRTIIAMLQRFPQNDEGDNRRNWLFTESEHTAAQIITGVIERERPQQFVTTPVLSPGVRTRDR